MDIFYLIALTGLFIGLMGAIILLSKKFPQLKKVEDDHRPVTQTLKDKVSKLQLKALKLDSWKDLAVIDALEKLLMKMRVLVLKLDNKLIAWVESVRVNYKNQKPNPIFSPDYWDNLKNAGKKKKTSGKKVMFGTSEEGKVGENKENSESNAQ
ncbi:MAG TPA: hypothetical protein PKM84_01200 [Candidatus Pacearchaeota archaeon]|nr:hypothetical protein [Candidatus Pacearchaeota archaeon]